MRLTRLHIVALLTVALAAAALSSCSEDEKGGTAGTGKPMTLRIGTDDEPGKPASDQIKEFARRVQRISDGDLRIEPVWHAAGDGPDWDQRVARMITSGELDMGLIPSRSWDTEGVTSLRALNAPFLIESDELLGEVVSGELADDLMSGLGKASVTGIALFPEGLRHPFGLKRPLRGPDDYEGVTIRTPTSKTTAAVFEAMGASSASTQRAIAAGRRSIRRLKQRRARSYSRSDAVSTSPDNESRSSVMLSIIEFAALRRLWHLGAR